MLIAFFKTFSVTRNHLAILMWQICHHSTAYISDRDVEFWGIFPKPPPHPKEAGSHVKRVIFLLSAEGSDEFVLNRLSSIVSQHETLGHPANHVNHQTSDIAKKNALIFPEAHSLNLIPSHLEKCLNISRSIFLNLIPSHLKVNWQQVKESN